MLVWDRDKARGGLSGRGKRGIALAAVIQHTTPSLPFILLAWATSVRDIGIAFCGTQPRNDESDWGH
jgi:hypothetical protein